MTTKNPYFRPYTSTLEQNLLEGLIREAINIHGEEVLYLPRKAYSEDPLYTEDPQHYFDEAIPTVMYLKQPENWGSEGNFLSLMGGLEIRSMITLTLAASVFIDDVCPGKDFTRPREGDLVWFPQNKKLFEVAYTDKFTLFYPLGDLYSYDITCELFEYSGQSFTTGYQEIDSITSVLDQDIFNWALKTEDGLWLQTEAGDYLMPETYQPTSLDPLDGSQEISKEVDDLLDFTETDPFTETSFE